MASREFRPWLQIARRQEETPASPEYPDNSNGSARKSTDPSSLSAPESPLPRWSLARRPPPAFGARRYAPGSPRDAGCACVPPRSIVESELLRKPSAHKRHTKIPPRCAPSVAANSTPAVPRPAPPAARSAPKVPVVSAPVFLPERAAAFRCAAISRWKFSEWIAAAAAQSHREACPTPHPQHARFRFRSVSRYSCLAALQPPPAVRSHCAHPARQKPPRNPCALPRCAPQFLPPRADKDCDPP